MMELNKAINETLEKVQNLQDNCDYLAGVPTGYPALDEYINGWQMRKLIVIEGDANSGKTAFALGLARNLAKDSGVPVGYISPCLSSDYITTRLISMASGVPIWKIVHGKSMEKEDWQWVERSLMKLASAPLFIDDGECHFYATLRKRIYDMERMGAKVIFIDNLQDINSRSEKSYEQRILEVLDELKEFVRCSYITIVLISRTHGERYDEWADAVISIERADIDPRVAKIKIPFNKLGRTGSFMLGFIPECVKFEE